MIPSVAATLAKCDCFTLITIENGQIASVANIDNPPHEEGGCMRPVMLLSDAGADAIVAARHGHASVHGFTEAGIDVYFENETPKVGDVAELIAQGKVEKMTADNTCHH